MNHRSALQMTRRRLMGLGLVGAGGMTLPWRLASASTAPSPSRKLVVVMLRGAVDGLSVVVPHAERDYARQRPDIAIAPPGAEGGALPLDSLFGLHPSLGALMPWWQSQHLAFVHASGAVDPTRSHFDAQDHMETGTPGRRATPDGWMNRLLSVMDAQAPGGTGAAMVHGVNLGATMPRILSGPAQVAAMPAGGADRRSGNAQAPSPALARLYADDPGLQAAWAAMQHTRQAMIDSMTDTTPSAMVAGASPGMDAGIAPGAVALSGLATDAARLGRLMRKEPELRAAFLSVGGWDTHVAQGAARGQLSNRLQALAGGLNALATGLGERFDDTVILVMSEFGRTVRQNGTRGTDHGHGNVMWLMGGGVRGGRVHGQWPGLDASALHEGRDLAITTDFRQVIAAILERHLGLSDAGLARVLPDGAGTPAGLDILKA